MSWAGVLVRRLRGALVLLCAAAFLATAALAGGAALFVRGRALEARVPEAARLYVVTRSALIDATRELLEALPEARLVGERRATEILESPGDPSSYPDRLRVIEIAIAPLPSEASLAATMQQVRGMDGVVELIDLNAQDRLEATPERALRHLVLGVALLILGAGVFAAALIATLRIAARACGEEIGARILLGTDAVRLWAPLGFVVALAALLGAGLAVLSSVTAARFLPAASADGVPLAMALPPRWLASFACVALPLGAIGLAMVVARQAVAGATRAMALAVLASLVWLLGVPPVGRALEEGNGGAAEIQQLRQLAHELALCRHSLHVARLGFVGTERRALRAAAESDAIALRLATAQRLEDLRDVARWEEACEALLATRAYAREALRAARTPEPPIEPRLRPVTGAVAVSFGQGGRRGQSSAFRNGVGLATRPGETVRATAPGRVAFAGALAGAGTVVVVDHGQRTFSVYAKIAEALVVRGMDVEAGEPIARAGSEPLYFSIRRRGKVLDPVGWVGRSH